MQGPKQILTIARLRNQLRLEKEINGNEESVGNPRITEEENNFIPTSRSWKTCYGGIEFSEMYYQE